MKNLQETAQELLKENPYSPEGKIFGGLITLDFGPWYNEKFRPFLRSDKGAPTKEQILKDIKKIFEV